MIWTATPLVESYTNFQFLFDSLDLKHSPKRLENPTLIDDWLFGVDCGESCITAKHKYTSTSSVSSHINIISIITGIICFWPTWRFWNWEQRWRSRWWPDWNKRGWTHWRNSWSGKWSKYCRRLFPNIPWQFHFLTWQWTQQPLYGHWSTASMHGIPSSLTFLWQGSLNFQRILSWWFRHQDLFVQRHP